MAPGLVPGPRTCWVEDDAGAGVEDASELLEAAEGVEDGGS